MLENLFVSKVRLGILILFLKNPGAAFHVRAITREIGTEINAVRRELKNLQRLGFLKRQEKGNRVYFEAKKSFPFYEELAAMIFKEAGFGRKILDSVSLLGKVKWIFVSKDFVKGKLTGPGKIDLLILGEVFLPALENLIAEEEKLRGREINYTVMTEPEFKTRQRRKDAFLEQVLQIPRVNVTGDEEHYSGGDY